MRLRPELAKGRSADQMGLGVEAVVDGGMGGEETLGLALCLNKIGSIRAPTHAAPLAQTGDKLASA